MKSILALFLSLLLISEIKAAPPTGWPSTITVTLNGTDYDDGDYVMYWSDDVISGFPGYAGSEDSGDPYYIAVWAGYYVDDLDPDLYIETVNDSYDISMTGNATQAALSDGEDHIVYRDPPSDGSNGFVWIADPAHPISVPCNPIPNHATRSWYIAASSTYDLIIDVTCVSRLGDSADVSYNASTFGPIMDTVNLTVTGTGVPTADHESTPSTAGGGLTTLVAESVTTDSTWHGDMEIELKQLVCDPSLVDSFNVDNIWVKKH